MVLFTKITGEFNSDILDFVKKFASKEDFKECTITKSAEGKKGEGYVGVMTFVKIEGKTNSGGEKTLKLAVKTSIKNDQYRKDLPVHQMYKTEIFMYSKVFPEFLKFQNSFMKIDSEKSLDVIHPDITSSEMFSSVTKCLYSQTEEMQEGLVFQNLKELGFKLCDRKRPMNEEHIVLILKEYAKFHAISFAMKDEKPEHFQKLVNSFGDIFNWTYCKESYPIYYKNMDHCINLFDNDDERRIQERLEKCKEEMIDYLKYTGYHKDEYSVILHGDCWCNNMMFQYEDNSSPSTPTKLCLLDFQGSQLGSLVMDLSYFMYSCCPCEIIGNFDHYIKDIYYDTLSRQIRHFGKDPNVLYPFSKLKEEWKKFGKFGLYVSMVVCRIAYSEDEEVPDLVGAAEKGSVMTAYEVKAFKNEDLYNRRIRSVIMHLYKENSL